MVSSFTSSDPQTQTAEFNVTFPMPNQWDFTFDANTDEQAMQAFNEYNAKFDNKFTLLPEKHTNLMEKVFHSQRKLLQ